MMVPDPARRIGCGLPDRAEHLNSATRIVGPPSVTVCSLVLRRYVTVHN